MKPTRPRTSTPSIPLAIALALALLAGAAYLAPPAAARAQDGGKPRAKDDALDSLLKEIKGSKPEANSPTATKPGAADKDSKPAGKSETKPTAGDKPGPSKPPVDTKPAPAKPAEEVAPKD